MCTAVCSYTAYMLHVQHRRHAMHASHAKGAPRAALGLMWAAARTVPGGTRGASSANRNWKCWRPRDVHWHRGARRTWGELGLSPVKGPVVLRGWENKPLYCSSNNTTTHHKKSPFFRLRVVSHRTQEIWEHFWKLRSPAGSIGVPTKVVAGCSRSDIQRRVWFSSQ
eukprot:COSAG01_NODE_8854_length_2637_cov_1.841214_2_plen_167_part_00